MTTGRSCFPGAAFALAFAALGHFLKRGRKRGTMTTKARHKIHMTAGARKATLRKLTPKARKLAKLAAEARSLSVKLANLGGEIMRAELEERAQRARADQLKAEADARLSAELQAPLFPDAPEALGEEAPGGDPC